MKKLKYIFKRIAEMNFKEMIKSAKRIAINNHTLTLFILFDMIYCGFKYLAGYVDYEVFDFYNLNKSQRETIITRGINNKFVATLNDKRFVCFLDNKLLFNEKFNKYLKRDWLDLGTSSVDDFKKFISDKEAIIAKPANLACGRNVDKILIKDISNINDEYDLLIKNSQLLLEDYVIQHDLLNELYPCSVNTLRIVTITKDKVVNIMFRSIRMGNSGNVVDNFNHGGLFTTIDESGLIDKPAIDKLGNVYEYHPFTKVKITGFKIPFFKEAIEYVKTLALEIPEVGYVGWDIAITKDGPLVIEANPFPGHDIYQSKIHMNIDRTGMRKKFEDIIYSQD